MKDSLIALRDIEKNYKSVLLTITKRSKLTIAEWQLLLQIEAGYRTQEQLSDATKLDTSTLSRQLKNLVTKEMLQKTPTGRDKRQLVYSMSQAGKKAIIEIDTAFADLSTRIFDRWTDEENNLLRILLNRLDKSIARVSKQ
ncbi:MAG: MarR family transcriptional regulator [Lactobacillus sp.]|nr:MAG: MarR family transcriptional regulator [Lactobacillus sp.]